MIVILAPFSIFVPGSIVVVRALIFVTDPLEKITDPLSFSGVISEPILISGHANSVSPERVSFWMHPPNYMEWNIILLRHADTDIRGEISHTDVSDILPYFMV